jgi:membrane-associated protease RseP (regulator of RpoE activity)
MSEVNDIDLFATAAYKVINDYFEITLYRPTDTKIVFYANPILHKRGWKREMNRRLAMIQARAKIECSKESYSITISRLTRRIDRPPLVNTLLFVLTLLTVLIMAAYQKAGNDIISDPSRLLEGIPFTITLMIILLIHEMGHFLAGYKRGVIMSYPFFIPAPNIFGTFGAVIRTRTPIRSRSDLIAIGASGPLAGALPAFIAIIIGYTHSEFVIQSAQPLFTIGNSLLTIVAREIIIGPVPQGMSIDFSPMAVAGQAGLLVTMINLLPLGQLDGGHIIYGLFGRNQRRLAILFLAILFGLGFFWRGWWIWMALAIILRPFHPPVIDEGTGLDRKHKIMGWAALILFLFAFAPMPIN